MCVCVCMCVSPSGVFNCLQAHGLYPQGSSVHGILQARILDWVAIPCTLRNSKPCACVMFILKNINKSYKGLVELCLFVSFLFFLDNKSLQRIL